MQKSRKQSIPQANIVLRINELYNFEGVFLRVVNITGKIAVSIQNHTFLQMLLNL